MKFLYKILPGRWNGLFSKIQNALDGVYQIDINQSQWEKYHDIYYNLDKRYKNINPQQGALPEILPMTPRASLKRKPAKFR